MTEQPTNPMMQNPAGAPVTQDQLVQMAQADPYTQSVLQGGALPADIDVAAIMAQMAAMADQIAALQKERGVPSDPIAGALQNLTDHVAARVAQYPNTDFSEVLEMLKSLPADAKNLVDQHTHLVAIAVSELVDALRGHELGYLTELTGSLHKAVLKRQATTAALASQASILGSMVQPAVTPSLPSTASVPVSPFAPPVS